MKIIALILFLTITPTTIAYFWHASMLGTPAIPAGTPFAESFGLIGMVVCFTFWTGSALIAAAYHFFKGE